MIKLHARIAELESELTSRERDLNTFRKEISALNTQLERFIEQISQELKTAHVIQKVLVPTELPNISGFEFSTKYEASLISGGDYFDIFELGNKFHFGIILSSSSGHGMSALLLSVILKLSGQVEAKRGKAPKEVLELMARELTPNISGDEMASVFYGSIDRRRYEFTYSHVGDLVILYSAHGSEKLEKLKSCGPAFSKNFIENFQNTTIPLNPRDRLILVSNGMMKVTNDQSEPFGEERLYKTILNKTNSTPHELRNEIIFQAKKFSGHKELERDLTVIVLDVKDKVIKLTQV